MPDGQAPAEGIVSSFKYNSTITSALGVVTGSRDVLQRKGDLIRDDYLN